MSDDGQTPPRSPSVSDSPTRVDSAHCLLVVGWDCEGGLTMRKLMAKLEGSLQTWVVNAHRSTRFVSVSSA